MSDILIRPQELRQTAEQLQAYAKKIDVALQAIDNDMLSLKRDNFLGNRANTVQAHYAPKREALLKAKEIVSHFAEDLKDTATRFEAADRVGEAQSLPAPAPVPMPSPPPKNLPDNWDEICRISKFEKGITPELIAAVLEYERTHRNIIDGIGDIEAKFIMWYEGKLEDTEVFLLNKTLAMFGQSFETISFGPAQMNPEVVKELITKGYIAKPENWDTDQRDEILNLLLDEKKAPELVSARLEQIYDHWIQREVDISSRSDVLGNLYGIGLEGPRGIHLDLEDDQGPRGESIEKMVSEFLETQKI